MSNNLTTQVTITAKDLASAVFKNVSNELKTVGSSVKTFVGDNMQAGGIAAAALGASMVGLGVTAVSSAAKFESMAVSLKTAFQGNEAAADNALKTITAFAAQTPFQLEEVLTGFLKLKNMGLDPSEKALTSYGDTASAMGKSLNMMVEAVADAATGEFERLKEFGIRASSEGDKVTFTFQGVKTTVGKNAKEIEDYLIKLGQTKFAGGMAAQSKTFNGMMSTMKDTFALGMADIAKNSGLFDIAKEALSKFLVQMDKAVPKITNFIKSLAENKDMLMIIAGALGGLVVLAIGAFLIAFGPALIVMGLFAAAGALLVLAVKKIMEIFESCKKTVKEVGDSFNKFKEGVKSSFKSAKEDAGTFKDKLSKDFATAKTAVSGFVDLIVKGDFKGEFGKAMKVDEDSSIVTSILALRQKFLDFITYVKTLPAQALDAVVNFKNNVVTGFNDMVTYLESLPGKIMTFMTKLLIQDIPFAFGYMVGFVVFKAIELVKNVIEFFQQLPTALNNIWDNIKTSISNTAAALRDFVVFKAMELVMGVINFFMQLPGQVSNIFNNMSNIIRNIAAAVVSYVVTKFQEFVNTTVWLFNNFPTIAYNAFESMKNWVVNKANEMYNAAVSAWNSLVSAANSKFEEVKNAVNNKINEAKNSMVNSVNSWYGSFQNAIASIPGMVSNVFSQIGGYIGTALQNAYNTAMGWFNSLAEIWNNIIDGFNSAAQSISGGITGQSTAGNATGGIVPGAIGAPRVALVHGGEEIVPFGRSRGSSASSGGGGGSNITLNVNVGLYAGTETEKRNIAESLYKSLVMLAKSQNKTVVELLGT